MYNLAAKVARLAEDGQNYKSTLYSENNKKKVKWAYFLAINAIKKKDVIDKLLKEIDFFKEAKNKLWLVRVLVTELLWGKGKLPANIAGVMKKVASLKPRMLAILPQPETVSCEDECPTPRYVRINPDIFTRESATTTLKEKGFTELPLPDSYLEFLEVLKNLKSNEYIFDFHVPLLVVFSRLSKIDSLSPVDFIRQDKSSCLVSLLLAPVPGATILDMCAAPGYKTLHASSLVHKMGKIFSVERNGKRFKVLKGTCEDFKLEGCVEPIHMDALKTTHKLCPNVEYILVDPPCSGTGIHNVLMKHTADSDRLRRLSNLQATILKHALREFPEARRLVYSTCSVEAAENEGVVEECLASAEGNGWRLVPISGAFRGAFASPESQVGLRLSPSRDLTNGFYIALFERSVPPYIHSPLDNEDVNNHTKKEENGFSKNSDVDQKANSFKTFKDKFEQLRPGENKKALKKKLKRLSVESKPKLFNIVPSNMKKSRRKSKKKNFKKTS